MFEKVIYTVCQISGDYAILMTQQGVENTVAMALLPIDLCEGDTLVWENLEYTKA